jgi:very-short-patch-repair endonuclease
VAAGQHGVVSRTQLRELGLTDSQIAWAIDAGLLIPVFHGSFAVGHPAIGRIGAMRAATLSCGGDSYVSHRSAAELHGLAERGPVLIDLISANQAGRQIDGVRWHRSAAPRPDEVTTVSGIPCTAVARTLVDLAGAVGERALRGFIEEAAVQRSLDLGAIDRVLRRGRRRGAPRLRALLAAWRTDGGADAKLRSRLEARLRSRLAGCGLPLPRSNVMLDVAGTQIEVDFLWDDHRLVVETDGGATHSTPSAFQRDRLRDQLLVAAGYRVVRITWRQLELESDEVVTRIRTMLETAG